MRLTKATWMSELLGQADRKNEVVDQAMRKDHAHSSRFITESLARATNTPIEQVAEIYASESAELERTARIKSFIGVIATRRTRAILNERTGKHRRLSPSA